MALNEKTANVYVGYISSYTNTDFKCLGKYVTAIMIDGKKVYNSQTTAVNTGLADRADNIIRHLKRNKITHYKIINGKRIDDAGIRTDNGKIIECDAIDEKTEEFFKQTLDESLQKWLFSIFYEKLWSIAYPRRFN